ncbi:hypothetical protein [Nocardia sp. alder85J]|uniref:Rv0361 family membrane protein n=1 Tax=Nocardia sp. alder85J TaxID=2862949 RepID=UPI001CD57697|nr:hypothetical protein [Nocardia sp. alder85J]MCX4098917.1 hypothetical protein [Nocardia sp. alder85J]
MAIPRAAVDAVRAAMEQASEDPKTVAIPKVSDPSNEPTMMLPVQRPDADATEKIRTGPAAGTDRIVAVPGSGGPVGKPPVTPRPGSGPKNAGPQGPSTPPQGAPPARPGSAPSPADAQPTIAAPQVIAPQSAGPRPVARPQQVPATAAPAAATGGHRKSLLLGAGALVAVAIVIAVVIGVVQHATNSSPQAQVRKAVTTYTSALAGGDLVKLRAATCGQLHDFYQNIAADQFDGVHKLSVDQKKIPKISSIESVQITGDKAIAQAGVYTDSDPNHPVARSFDLERADGTWRVCDPPAAK